MATTIKPIGPVKPVIGQQPPQGTQPVSNQPQNGQQATPAIAPKAGEKTFNISTDKDPTGQFTKVFARDEQHAQQVYQQQANGAGQFKGAQLANEHIITMVGMLEENGIEEGRDYYVNGTIYTRDAVMAEDIIDIINMQDWDSKKAVHKQNGDEFYIDLELPTPDKKDNRVAIGRALEICKNVMMSDDATPQQKLEAKKAIGKIRSEMHHDKSTHTAVNESKMVDYEGIKLYVSIDGANADIRAIGRNGQQMGYVVFDRDGQTLVADDLAVDDKYKGQGIAKVMYDYVKSLGFNIRRSFDQTQAGKEFWDKNKGEGENVWEGEEVPTLNKDFNSKEDELAYIESFLNMDGGITDGGMYIDLLEQWAVSNANGGTLIKESLDDNLVASLKSIANNGVKPEIGKKYIPIPCQLFVSKLTVLGTDFTPISDTPPKFVTLTGIDGDLFSFSGRSWPNERMLQFIYATTILCDTVESYDEARMMIKMSFGVDMPAVDDSSMNEDSSNRTVKMLNICKEILSSDNASDEQKSHAISMMHGIKEQLHPSGIKERTSNMNDSSKRKPSQDIIDDILYDFHHDNMSVKEIASRVGLDQDTVKKIIKDHPSAANLVEGEKVSTKKGIIHKGSYGTEYEGDAPKKAAKSTTGKRGRPAKQDEVKPEYSKMNDLFGRTPDKAPAGKEGRKVKGAGTIDDDLEDISEDTSERPYVAVHAKKGKTEVTATSSYDAAKKAATKWKLKGTAGIDVHLADVKKIATEAKKPKAPKNPYAIGMAKAEKETGDTPPLKKSTITKAHKIAKEIDKKSDKKAKTVKESLAQARVLKQRISETIVKVQSLPMDQQNDPRIAAMVTKLEESVTALFETKETMDHIVKRFPAEVKAFAQGDELDSHLYDALYDYYHLHGEMPYGIAKSREGDPFQWVSDRFDQDVHQYVAAEPDHVDAENWDELDEATGGNKVWWSSSDGRIELQIDLSDVESATHSGDNEFAVREVMNKPYMKAQLVKLSPMAVANDLRGYGSWDDQELADKEMNLVRLLWIALHDLNDQDDHDIVDEGMIDTVKKFGKKAIDTLGHGSDEEMLKDLQKKSGVPQTGKKPEDKSAMGEDSSTEPTMLERIQQLSGIKK